MLHPIYLYTPPEKSRYICTLEESTHLNMKSLDNSDMNEGAHKKQEEEEDKLQVSCLIHN